MSDFEFLSITRNKLILFFSVTLSIALVIAIVMILVFTCRQKPSDVKKTTGSVTESEKIAHISITDFMFDEYSLENKEPKFYLFRERLKQWNEEQVKQFFIPTTEILREYFQKKNDNRVKQFFESIE